MTEDPRDYGLTAADLYAAADRLYDTGDPRLDPMRDVSARFGHIRSRLRALADAIDHGEHTDDPASGGATQKGTP